MLGTQYAPVETGFLGF